jgi:hypothetical protein
LVIHYEYRHLSKEDRRLCVKFLSRHGYKIKEEPHPNDVVAVLKKYITEIS